MFNVLLDLPCLQGQYGIMMYESRSMFFFNLYGKSQRDQTRITSLAIKHLMYAGAAAKQVRSEAHA